MAISVIVSVVYVPPSVGDSSFSSLLSYLSTLFSSDEHVIVVGDFNCPDLQWSTLSSTSPLSSALCEFVFDNNIYQAVEFPTHKMGNVLDLVFTNSVDPMCLSLVTAASLITSLLCSVSTNPPTNLLTSLIQFWTTPELTSVACVTFLVNMILVCSTSQVMLSSSGLL